MDTLSVLLVKVPDRRLDVEQVRALAATLSAVLPPVSEVAAHAGKDTQETYVYLYGAIARDAAGTFTRAQAAVTQIDAGWELVPLQLLNAVPGASAGKPAPFHYVVETDVVAGGEVELNNWYDQEHLPGLASVPGNVLAQRFRNPTGSPRYHACYELETTETMGSAPWLAVRHTAWSDIVRPMFMNAKRTMFDHICTFKS